MYFFINCRLISYFVFTYIEIIIFIIIFNYIIVIVLNVMTSSNNNNGSFSSKHHVADLAESAGARRSAISADVRDLITDFASSLYRPPHSFSLTSSIIILDLDFYFFSIEFGKYHMKILRKCSTLLPH